MSEPIQSISQGNYILQGTVATSAGIVGDGSTQNPLRADETVLWSGTRCWWEDTSDLACSENLTNFEVIRVKARDDWALPPTFTFFPGSNDGFDVSLIGYEGGSLVTKTSKFSVSGSTVSFVDKIMFQVKPDKTVHVNTDKSFIKFIEIVGINRKV